MQKIKSFLESEKGKDILVVIIVILVGLASFELGRLSKQSSGSGIKILYENQSGNVESSVDGGIENIPKTLLSTDTSDKNFFASSKGKKYYSVGCSAGKTIKQENRVYFNSSTEAESAGYTLSSTCK